MPDLMHQVLQEGGLGLSEHVGLLDPALPKVQSILIIDGNDLLQGRVQLAQVEVPPWQGLRSELLLELREKLRQQITRIGATRLPVVVQDFYRSGLKIGA